MGFRPPQNIEVLPGGKKVRVMPEPELEKPKAKPKQAEPEEEDSGDDE